MTIYGWLLFLLFSILLLLTVKPLGIYMATVMEGAVEGHSENKGAVLAIVATLTRPLGACENLLYKICRVDAQAEMRCIDYSLALLTFSLASALLSFAVLRLQAYLPLNPLALMTNKAPAWATTLSPDLAYNTAISFVTNTNWQAYAGESTCTYFSQMVALAMQNWASAAVGICVATVFIRGFSRSEAAGIGNFWRDLTRSTLYILLPLSLVSAVFLVSQGVVQNFDAYTTATTLEGAEQIIAQGPVASQEAIKMLGTNGGGFFNANSAHPFENPNALTNLVEMLSIFIIPAALTYSFGYLVKDVRQGFALLSVMFIIFATGFATVYHFESQGNPIIHAAGINDATSVLADLGGNMEGKEVRFGLAASSLFAVITTDASCGAVNCMHDSLTPLAGMITLLNIQLGEIIFGGVGAGLYGMLVFAVLTVFIAGLMVGRSPEYLGKKIEKKEVKMAILYVLTAAFAILMFTALAVALHLPSGDFLNSAGDPANNVANNGPHGLSEMLYAYSSATGNNGSAFAGLNANSPFWNVSLGVAMLFGRFFMIVPVLALAASLAKRKYVPPTSGSFPTNGPIFIVLLTSVIVIVGALTFFPALTLGPIAEHFLMHSGRLF
ncbi:MAG: potassium-transporting ATPase subunit KdpA [Cyanobacteria bacterium REEB67]|nr:potassium-transporting ATPase subunit KdpA [Cyanobacteria bacterium REEB67]